MKVESDLTSHVAEPQTHDHAAHALRSITVIASFYECDDNPRDALEAILTIANRGLGSPIKLLS